ncbi:Signal transduction histidine kinase [Chryseobacterium wanjuense]|uniref:histidine kinase n=1 Tax=Chryseobacterium wanjuense TaxID=356305 RepID=A0A1I0QFU6_9FLAO|nr:response regulator [Chryseobacterium wanjuense]SEW25974.1 Signal transduction histidine kinase [Chryseobacterium wanjuense]
MLNGEKIFHLYLLPLYQLAAKIPVTFKNVFIAIRSAGEASVPEKERPILRNFNTGSALMGIMVIVFGGIMYSLVPSTSFLIALLLETGAFAMLIYLNHRGKFEYAKVGLYAAHSCSAIYFGAWLGEALPVDMVIVFLFIYLTCSSCLTYKSWKARCGFIAATIVLSMIVYVNRSVQFIPVQHFPSEYLPLFTILSCGGMLSLIVYVTISMIRQNDKLTKEMEKANLNKTQYLNETSHELRTPLNSIIGNSQFLLDFKDQLQSLKDGDDLLKILTDVNAAGKIMTDIINNQLDMAKIEAGKFDETYITSFSLISVFKTCIDYNTTFAKRRNVTIVFDHDEQVNHIQSDELFLIKIVNNLLSNAIKFTEEGSEVVVSSTLTDGHIVFNFKNCSTISKEKADSFFKEYVSERNAQFVGTGLGLVITKKLIEQLGGSVTVHRAGAHTSFMVRLPYMPAMMKISSKAITQKEQTVPNEIIFTTVNESIQVLGDKRFDQVKILIAEDDPMSCAMLERILLQEGAVVLTTKSAEEAIAHLSDFSPDIIISDHNMPGMGGMGLLEYIQLQSIPIPVVIASACADKDHCKTFIEAGAVSYVLKPLNNTSLIATLSDILVKHSVIS